MVPRCLGWDYLSDVFQWLPPDSTNRMTPNAYQAAVMVACSSVDVLDIECMSLEARLSQGSQYARSLKPCETDAPFRNIRELTIRKRQIEGGFLPVDIPMVFASFPRLRLF